MHIAKRDCSCRVIFFASGKKAITNCFCASNLLAEMPNILSVFFSFHFWQIILQLTNRHEPTNHSTNLCRGKTWKLFWWHDEVFFWVVDMQDSRSLNKKCKWRKIKVNAIWRNWLTTTQLFWLSKRIHRQLSIREDLALQQIASQRSAF